MKADAVIVATGGISYPSTGSTGDGYRFARETGHRVTELLPSLVPMEVRQWYAKELQGLSLRNIEIRITEWEEKTLRRIRRDAFYTLWCNRTGYSERE